MNILFTVDGDWLEYTEGKLPEKEKFKMFLRNEIKFAKKYLNGKILHLIHFSPLSKFYFLDKEFLPFYKEIENIGGHIGIHLHMDVPLKKYNLFKENIDFIKEAIIKIKDQGLNPVAHRGGYFSYDNCMTKILEENGIHVELSNIPGRKFIYNNMIVSDWTNSLNRPYRLDYNNYLKQGDSKVWELPIGDYNNKYLYLETINVKWLKEFIEYYKKEHDRIFVLITHTYIFSNVRYNKYMTVCSNNYIRNKFIAKSAYEIKKIIKKFKFIEKLLKLKIISFQSLYMHLKIKKIIALIIKNFQIIDYKQIVENEK